MSVSEQPQANPAERRRSHRLLLENVWGPEYANDRQYLRIYINYLRNKLEDDPRKPCLVPRFPHTKAAERRDIPVLGAGSASPAAFSRRPIQRIMLKRARFHRRASPG